MKKVKTELQLPPEVLETAAGQKIEQLEKQVRSLENKLKRRDKTIQSIRDGLDISAERRTAIRALANRLFEELEDAGWVEIDRYYEC